jgi:hypothetical protein
LRSTRYITPINLIFLYANLNNLIIIKAVVPNLELFDETLDINSTANYNLALEVSHDGLSFCLHDSIRNKFVLLRSFFSEDDKKLKTEQIEGIFNSDDFLNRSFKSIKIVIPSARCTLVPAPLFDPAHKDDYFLFNHLGDESCIILNNKLSDPDANIVFSVSHKLHILLNEKFPGATLMHHLKPLLVSAHIGQFGVADKYVRLHVEKEFFNLLYFNEKKLIFCNTFSYRNVSDILYFVMYTFNNLGIKQDEVLYISGLVDHFDELYTNISDYIRSVKFIEPAGSATYSYVFNEVGLHRYINLFNATNCE